MNHFNSWWVMKKHNNIKPCMKSCTNSSMNSWKLNRNFLLDMDMVDIKELITTLYQIEAEVYSTLCLGLVWSCQMHSLKSPLSIAPYKCDRHLFVWLMRFNIWVVLCVPCRPELRSSHLQPAATETHWSGVLRGINGSTVRL